MSVALARLRKRAAELEQKKQFDRALEVYMQILDEGGKDLDDEDVPLFNRVGDMLMRNGSVTEALGYYERAVDMYAERGYLNNAIALCSKILRQSPGRAAVYYKLARISAKKGFKSDARKNFLEYADRMQKLGMAEEAFRALKEFASLYPDQDDVRLVLAELLSKENRKGEALEQLQSLYEKLQSEGRGAEARATIDRMRAIDPNATPREGTEAPRAAPAGDLVFLDLSDGESNGTPRSGKAMPASARAPVPTPVPALSGLSITFVPTDAEPTPHPEGFESTAVEPVPEKRDLTPRAGELVAEPPRHGRSLPDIEAIVPFDALGTGSATSAPPPESEMLDDLLTEATRPAAPARHQTPKHNTPMTGLQFADLELGDARRELAQREHDLTLPGELPDTPEETPTVPGPSPASDAAAEDARAAAADAADLAADMAAREAALYGGRPIPRDPTPPAPVTPPVEDHYEPPPPEHVEEFVPLIAPAEDPEPAASQEAEAIIPDDFLSMPPSFGGVVDSDDDHAFPPLSGLAESALEEEVAAEEAAAEEAAAEEAAAEAASEEAAKEEAVEAEAGAEPPAPEQEAGTIEEPRVATPRVTVSIGSAEAHLRRRLELEPENWELRRQLGEALLDTGDRDGGLYELELAMVGFELVGDMDRAQEVVDEILGVFPASVAHHQKRVEYAVRSRDRARLTNSYLELADALFRSGAGDKAVAVYGRVLELDPANERAELALATLAPDELVRLRTSPSKGERWTEELDAIEGEAASGSAAQPAAPDEAAAPDELVAAPPPAAGEESRVPEARAADLDIPDPDWEEGAPADGVDRAPSGDVEPIIEEIVLDEQLAALDAVAETPVEVRAAEPELIGADALVDPPENLHAPAPREPTPRTSTPPQPVRRVSTPRSTTPIEVVKTAAHRLTPAGAADSEFVDLGEWLRHTEPTRSTRMQVEDPKPTGDEQADFEEMLRRFKRGVAENVDAEDYEAHYDLGVAYKEMGLIDEAIAQFQKSLRGASYRVRSYEALGQCFVEKEQYPIAAALLQRATEVPGSDDQQLVGVLYLLGFATEHLGRPANALPYYLRVFAVDIEFRDIAARVAALGNETK
jgi:tetratricopeptide (TPR) repeat protein